MGVYLDHIYLTITESFVFHALTDYKLQCFQLESFEISGSCQPLNLRLQFIRKCEKTVFRPTCARRLCYCSAILELPVGSFWISNSLV